MHTDRRTTGMAFDLYVWKSPAALDAEGAEALIAGWRDVGGDPRQSPFEPSTDVGWFYRELMHLVPGLDATSDAAPNASRGPIWLSGESEPPARVVAMDLATATPRDALGSILGLAAKYDLVLFDTRSRLLHRPLEELLAHASATFWPSGAVQAALAGGFGAVIAIAAWFIGIPLLSGIIMVVGGFLFVMAVYSFLHEGRKALTVRRTGGRPPPGA
jgi:hypothetical protein